MSTDVKENIAKIRSFMKSRQLDAVFINDTDRYLNEYVANNQAHYYLLTNFSGSTAKVLIPMSGKIKLYVDGRYHEQADIECDDELVEVVKCPQRISIFKRMIEDIVELNIKKLGVDGQRTSLFDEEYLSNSVNAIIEYLDKDELLQVVNLAEYPDLKDLIHYSDDVCGKSSLDKVRNLIKEDEIYFVSALDNIAWITNTRGFHLSFQSTYLAKCILSYNKIFVCNVESEKYAESFSNDIEFENVPIEKWGAKVKQISNMIKPRKVLIDKDTLIGADYRILKSIFTDDQIKNPDIRIIEHQSIKNAEEIKSIENSYSKSNKVIAKLIGHIKDEIKNGKKLTEKDFFNITNNFYKKEGAVDQSFNTIAAVGPNASIIHYSKSSEKIKINEGDMLLLDSGALYDEGYATDKTRTFLVGKTTTDKHKEIYTLVLKGLLNAQNAIVPDGALGASIDILARQPILQKGYNYLHSTGHGIGINTHEGGIGFSSKMKLPIKEGQVVSIEPGIYLPGFGGVRLENIIVVENNPAIEGTLKFRPLVYIGFDHDLINFDLLSSEEQNWLQAYEKECEKQGTL